MPTLTFTTGADSYIVTGTEDFTLNFLAGADTLDARGTGFTTALMGDGADRAYLRSGDGNISGNDGGDRFDIFGSGFEVHGGDDADLFILRGGNNLSLFGDLGPDRFDVEVASSALSAQGGAGDDVFLGHGQVVSGNIYGQSGNDRFFDFSNAVGAVVLRGGNGDDVYRFHAGTSATFVEGVDAGTDTVQVARGVAFSLFGSGSANIENITVVTFPGNTLESGLLEGNELANVIVAHNNRDSIWGREGNDRIFGKGQDDTIEGDIGDDYIDGGDANDFLYGEAGNDALYGGIGFDWMEGGAGDDVYFVDDDFDSVFEVAGAGADTVRVLAGVENYTLTDDVEKAVISNASNVSLRGNALDNVLIGGSNSNFMFGDAGDDTMRAGGGSEQLNGGLGNDVLVGGSGDDELYGFEDDDKLVGESGNDQLFGLTGDDTLIGGIGTDFMGGGDGVNVYVFTSLADSTLASPDTIISEIDTDILNLVAIDADTTIAGNQAFTIVSAPSSTPGELWSAPNGGGLDVFGDVNGDGAADFKIIVQNWISLTTEHVVE